MTRSTKVLLSVVLICLILVFIIGLYFSLATPNKEIVTLYYKMAGYKTAKLDFGDYSIRTYSKNGTSVLIIWYGDSDLADGSIVSANKVKLEKFAVKRGNAVAIGYEKDIRIFQMA